MTIETLTKYIDAIPGDVEFQVVFEGEDDFEDHNPDARDIDEPEERPGQAEAALRVMSIVQCK